MKLTEVGRSTKNAPGVAKPFVLLAFPMPSAGNQVSERHPNPYFTSIYGLNEWILGPDMVMELLPNPVPIGILRLSTP